VRIYICGISKGVKLMFRVGFREIGDVNNGVIENESWVGLPFYDNQMATEFHTVIQT
jgi:hypothetical protein